MDAHQLAERLEKSEAGRKKLRQAISILQEKLEATDKVLKANEILQKECDKERLRADNEKQKAEEEKRLKSLLEKDSATFKGQLAKVLQRLGAVENKQKADKKEIERLRNEVKLSAEGMRAATQAVNAVQSSFQTLETSLLEKVNAAFEETRAAMQAVKHMQGSLQSMEQMTVKQVSSFSNQRGLPPAGHALEKLVDEISCLFNKERQSHCKIEHRLSMLKSVLKVQDLESLAFSKKEKDKVSKKRKSRGEEDVFDRRVRKRKEVFDVPAVNSAVNRLAFSGHEQADKDQSLSSPHMIVHERTSDGAGSLPVEPRFHNTASNDYHEEAVIDRRGSSKGNAGVQVPPRESLVTPNKENLKDPMVQNMRRGDCKRAIMQKKCGTDLKSRDDCEGSHATRKNITLAEQKELEQDFCETRDTANMSIDVVNLKDDEATDFDPDGESSDESEEWWRSSGRILLSPSLPEIPSPVPSREPLPGWECIDSVTDSSVSRKVLVNDAYVVCDAANLQGDVIDHNPDSMACSSQLGGTSSDICNPPGSCSGFGKQQRSKPGVSSETELVLNTPSELEGTSGVASFEMRTCSEPVSKSAFGNGSSLVLDNPQFEVDMLEAVGAAPLAEIDDFLEVLPPLAADTFPSEFCASDPSLSAPKEPVSSTCPVDSTLNQPQPACERQAIEKGCTEETGETSPGCINVDPNNDPISKGRPTGIESSDLEGTRDKEISSVVESLSGIVAEGRLPSTTKPSSPSKASSICTVFLLQAFEIEGVDVKVDLTAACIIVSNWENLLWHTDADKEGVEPQEIKLYKASMGLPLVYMACCIISSAVSLVRSEKGGAEPSVNAKPIYSLLQTYVAFIKSMFKEKANIMLNTILAQLSRFLIQGEAMLVTLQGTVTSCEDPLGFARAIYDKKQCMFEYFEAALEDIYAGGKVLAALCQVLACVAHLQNIVYEVLGWCDKDIIWLLTVFSSFSSICGHMAFMVKADDLLGHAICAIILELVASVEQDSGKKAELQASKDSPSLLDVHLNNFESWALLKGALKINDTVSVKQVLVAAMGALQYLLGSTKDSLLSAFVKTELLTAKDCVVCGNEQRENSECTDISLKRFMEDSCIHLEVSILSKTIPESLLKNQVGSALKTLGQHKWQKKYVEAVAALELISQFMGWNWTYNHLVLQYLWKMIASGSTQICVAGVSHVLGTLTRIATKSGGMELPGLEDLNEHLLNLMRSTSTLLGKADSSLLFDPQ
ncbi:hypothetical protein L7F22_031796 [Adiantum nelumboides]|nr:hypothetical protein [Adiantum nelumboides]